MFDSLKPLEVFLETKRFPFKKQEHHRASCARIEYHGEVICGIGGCLRSQWYSHKGIEPSDAIDTGGLMNIWLGGVFEEAYEKGLKEMAIPYIREYAYQKDIGLKRILSFRADFVVKGNGHWEGIEEKTAYGQGMNCLKEGKYRPGNRYGPKNGYLLQQIIYLTQLKLSKAILTTQNAPKEILDLFGDDEEVPLAMFHNPTFARDSSYRRKFEIFAEEDGTFSVSSYGKFTKVPWTFSMIKESWAKLEHYLEVDQMPPRDFDKEDKKNGYMCRYCKYRSKCYNKEVKE